MQTLLAVCKSKTIDIEGHSNNALLCFQAGYLSGKKCCCPDGFEGDKYYVSIQTLNATWFRGLGDKKSKHFNDAIKNYKNELQEFIVGPALKEKLLNFDMVKFKRGSGSVVVVETEIKLKQSHANNNKTIKDALRSQAIIHNYNTTNPKTL